ncbi:MAG: CHAT domain-containing protein [Gammaproteobacteria bacterium]
MNEPRFEITWEAGPAAQLEIVSPNYEPKGDAYRLRYTPPFRATIRPGMVELQLYPKVLDPLRLKLDTIVSTLDARRSSTGGPNTASDGLMDAALEVGGTLFDLVVPPGIRADLRTNNLFLEVGIDEALVEFPWELLHDGEEFLCLRHRTGRFVNTSRPPIPPQQPEQPLDRRPTELNVLLICVPQPLTRDGTTYRPLPGVDAETRAIQKAFGAVAEHVRLTIVPNATYTQVRNALKEKRWHIVHFSGHAEFDEKDSRNSGLVLHDRRLTPAEIQSYCGSKPPVFFCLNACETAKTAADARWKDRYDIFGIARGCLETGAYLVGNRWPVGDDGAAAFASAFYTTLCRGGTLGEAVVNGRTACRESSEDDDLSWASYVFYGDPRLCFRCPPNNVKE